MCSPVHQCYFNSNVVPMFMVNMYRNHYSMCCWLHDSCIVSDRKVVPECIFRNPNLNMPSLHSQNQRAVCVRVYLNLSLRVCVCFLRHIRCTLPYIPFCVLQCRTAAGFIKDGFHMGFSKMIIRYRDPSLTALRLCSGLFFISFSNRRKEACLSP